MIYIFLILSMVYSPSYYIFTSDNISSLFDDSSISYENNYLRVSLGMKTLFNVEDKNIWDIDYKDGQFALGGSSGIYYGRDNEIKKIKNIDSDVFSVCIYKKSIVYYQDGKLRFIDSNGNIKREDSLGVGYVWRIIDYKGSLYLFCGMPASVIKISGYNIDTLFTLPDKHIMTGTLKKNKIYCGTDNGRLYEYDILKNKGKAVLYDKNMGEIVGLDLVKDTLYFISSNYFEGDSNVDINSSSEDNGNKDKKEAKNYYVGKVVNGKVINITKCSSSGIGVFNNDGKNYLMYSSGNVVKMLYNGMESDAGTTKGEYFQLIKRVGNKVFAIDSPGGNVYEIRNANKGYIVSPIISAEVMGVDSIIKWGKVVCDYEGKIDIFVRGGFVDEIDTTWTKWEKIDKDIKLNTPYIQWKCVLYGKAKLFRVLTSSLSINRDEMNMPKIKNIFVTMPFKSVYLSDDEKKGPVSLTRNMDVDITMSDMGENNISYLYIEKDGKRFLMDSLDVTDNISFSFNAKLLEDGYYKCYVEIRDKNGNVKDSLESDKFYVDNTPPHVVKYNKKGGNIEFMIRDSNSVIKSCYISNNLSKFSLIFPVDSIFDEKTEKFKTKSKGKVHLIFYDEYMNMGEYIE